MILKWQAQRVFALLANIYTLRFDISIWQTKYFVLDINWFYLQEYKIKGQRPKSSIYFYLLLNDRLNNYKLKGFPYFGLSVKATLCLIAGGSLTSSDDFSSTPVISTGFSGVFLREGMSFRYWLHCASLPTVVKSGWQEHPFQVFGPLIIPALREFRPFGAWFRAWAKCWPTMWRCLIERIFRRQKWLQAEMKSATEYQGLISDKASLPTSKTHRNKRL